MRSLPVVAQTTKLKTEGSEAPKRKRSVRRLSGTHILIAVVVILAFILNFLVLQDRSASTLVAVARHPLTSGSVLTAEDVRLIPLESGFEGMGSLVTESQLQDLEGWVMADSISEGALLSESSLVEPGGPSGLRAMSVPVSLEHAAGGSLTSGDRIDVITVVDGEALYVVDDVEVVAVADATTAAIGATGSYHIVVAVTADEALSLAEAIASGDLEVVKSTGAPRLGGANADS